MQPLTGAYGNVGVAFARHGIVAAIIGDRQYPQVRSGDDSLDDIAGAIRFVRRLFGPDDATLATHSPISYARAHHPPLLFIDSTGDQQVCLDGFRKMKARMAAVGSPARFVELANMGHNETVLRIGSDDDPVTPALLAFVR